MEETSDTSSLQCASRGLLKRLLLVFRLPTPRHWVGHHHRGRVRRAGGYPRGTSTMDTGTVNAGGYPRGTSTMDTATVNAEPPPPPR